MTNEDKATRYHRLRRRISLASTVTGAICLLLLLVTGLSASIRDLAVSVTAGSFLLSVIVFTTMLVLLSIAVQLPFSVYEDLVVERRYGLSTQSTGKWCLDQIKGTAVALVFSTVAALIVMTFLRWTPDYWWLLAALCFTAILVGLAQLAPVVLLPLFYDFKPLDRPALTARLIALAERAGARVTGRFEWRLSDRTKKANAALTGIGRTRRILLSDTLLAEHSDDEIEVILAHELAHHVYRDIWTGMAFEAGLILAGCYLADVALTAFASSFGLTGKPDVAALPLLLLAGGAVSIVLLPFFNAFSRLHERRADRFALDMTGNADAFISAMRRLAAQNLAEDRPSRLVEVLFYTHPPTAARVGAAREHARRRHSQRHRGPPSPDLQSAVKIEIYSAVGFRSQASHHLVYFCGQPFHHIGGTLPARQTHALTGPQRQHVGASLPGCGLPQRPRQRVLIGKRQRRTGRIDLAHEAIDDAARRASRECSCDARFVFARREDGLLVGVGDARLLARQERGPKLRGRRAEREGCGDTAAVHDAARRDNGDADSVHHLRDECHCPDQRLFERHRERSRDGHRPRCPVRQPHRRRYARAPPLRPPSSLYPSPTSASWPPPSPRPAAGQT